MIHTDTCIHCWTLLSLCFLGSTTLICHLLKADVQAELKCNLGETAFTLFVPLLF